MAKQIQEAYIVAATRTPIGRSHKGFFRNTRPDELLAAVLRSALAQVPGLDPGSIEDVICGCAIPEAQQGLCGAGGRSIGWSSQERGWHNSESLLCIWHQRRANGR